MCLSFLPTLVTTADGGVVKGLKVALVGPGVLGGVKTDLGSSVGLGGLEEREGSAVKVHVPGGGTGSDSRSTGNGGTRAPDALGSLGRGRAEASLLCG